MKTNNATTTAFEILKSTPESNDFLELDVKEGGTVGMLESKVRDELRQPENAIAIINQLLSNGTIDSRKIAEMYLEA